MEVGAVTFDAIPPREIRKMRVDLATLGKETAALRHTCNATLLTPVPASAAPVLQSKYKQQNFHGAPKNISVGTEVCYECGFMGHFVSDCAQCATRLSNVNLCH